MILWGESVHDTVGRVCVREVIRNLILATMQYNLLTIFHTIQVNQQFMNNAGRR